jgi:hypothetical protein
MKLCIDDTGRGDAGHQAAVQRALDGWAIASRYTRLEQDASANSITSEHDVRWSLVSLPGLSILPFLAKRSGRRRPMNSTAPGRLLKTREKTKLAGKRTGLVRASGAPVPAGHVLQRMSTTTNSVSHLTLPVGSDCDYRPGFHAHLEKIPPGIRSRLACWPRFCAAKSSDQHSRDSIVPDSSVSGCMAIERLQGEAGRQPVQGLVASGREADFRCARRER